MRFLVWNERIQGARRAGRNMIKFKFGHQWGLRGTSAGRNYAVWPQRRGPAVALPLQNAHQFET